MPLSLATQGGGEILDFSHRNGWRGASVQLHLKACTHTLTCLKPSLFFFL